jgi:shikimate dehydrogenase
MSGASSHGGDGEASGVISRYAVIGDPVAHSKSPQIHAAFARQTGERIRYDLLHAPRGTFVEAVARFAGEGGRGLNVTLPFKEEAFALASDRSPRATLAGACNTLVRTELGWYGENTDGAGLLRDLGHNLHWALEGRSILVLGAGGATRGILAPLLQARPRRLAIANRTSDKARALATAMTGVGAVDAIGFDVVPRTVFDLVINATSAAHSTADPAARAWPELAANPALRAYDLAYGAAARPFLRWVRERGAHEVADGLGMLVEQAAESFFLWRGVRPDTRPVLEALRAAHA